MESTTAKADAYKKIAAKISGALSVASDIGDFDTAHRLRCIYHTIKFKETNLRNSN